MAQEADGWTSLDWVLYWISLILDEIIDRLYTWNPSIGSDFTLYLDSITSSQCRHDQISIQLAVHSYKRSKVLIRHFSTEKSEKKKKERGRSHGSAFDPPPATCSTGMGVRSCRWTSSAGLCQPLQQYQHPISIWDYPRMLPKPRFLHQLQLHPSSFSDGQ